MLPAGDTPSLRQTNNLLFPFIAFFLHLLSIYRICKTPFFVNFFLLIPSFYVFPHLTP
ncbi:hypothetical protein HMPREF1548_02792 [Clostridium sp. KLE 1755]|nr:hypothetical protein HMPREF1548_02792 [Clostridium sp. KLE 1755]